MRHYRWRVPAKTRLAGRLVVVVACTLLLASCSTRYDMGVVRDGDELVAVSACDNDQQLTSVRVSVKRADGDLGGSLVWTADVVDTESNGVPRIVLGREDTDVFRHDVNGAIPDGATLLVEGSYPDTLSSSVVVDSSALDDGEAATPHGIVSLASFEDNLARCGELSFGFLWPVLWVLLGLIVIGAGVVAVGSAVDNRRDEAARKWEEEQARKAKAARRRPQHPPPTADELREAEPPTSPPSR